MENELRLTPEETKEVSDRLVGIIDKWHSDTWSTSADYSAVSAESEIHQFYMNEVLPKVLKHRLDRPELREKITQLRFVTYGLIQSPDDGLLRAKLTKEDIDQILTLLPSPGEIEKQIMEMIEKSMHVEFTADTLRKFRWISEEDWQALRGDKSG